MGENALVQLALSAFFAFLSSTSSQQGVLAAVETNTSLACATSMNITAPSLS
jgi:hypothetical protein